MERLVASPIFIFSPPRSGSTLLRTVLDSHSEIHAPHELHLSLLAVQTREWSAGRHAERYAEIAIDALGLTLRDLEHLLWDRLLHRQLVRSGKRLIVNKTTNEVLTWRRVAECWPGARYIYLVRHPASIAASLARAWEGRVDMDPVGRTAGFVRSMNEARAELPGLTVRYEELTTNPADVARRLCAFLDVPWEPTMTEYGRFGHGPFTRGIGDWSDNIRSGRIQPHRPLPGIDEVPEDLREPARSWHYPIEAPRPTAATSGPAPR
ncbi:sulfotransferase [Frankia sp. AgB1.9]|uniref:sulfotransferase family protein n=1 Tax=unclassified Frankia TaxID=2632575 RepID=UPI001931BDAB|nr:MULTISPECIES: sulfotransferase [unclassified Frankia]MBL7488295.1 sulfotransferase [Frankia sp. AgW1.1]MBL7548550.1 sulfotransferase [Frankia sp. AgB1.9]MBL7619553.1 sulfotransferase [Frankia sp. AgB1.8]